MTQMTNTQCNENTHPAFQWPAFRWFRALLVGTLVWMTILTGTPLYAQSGTVPFSPNDPEFQAGHQYALALTNAQAGWAYSSGDPNVTVALIDTGIDYNHPELADHIHPDGRTFFLSGSPQDEDGHGTLTAGIIAATAHNGIGIAGMAANVQILPIKVSPGQATRNLQPTQRSVDGTMAVTAVDALNYNFQEPIRYAASPERNGTKVININFATSIEDPHEGAAIYDAVANGVVVVAAAGNSAKDVPLYPAAYDCVLGVGAVNAQAERANFSTYGLGVDVVAPGVNVLSTALASQHDGYGYVHGTSFASPHVSGLAALIFSVRPDLSAWDVREIIMRSAHDLGKPGFDAEYGYGLIDVGAALALATHWEANTGRTLTECTGNRYRIYGSLYFDENQNGVRDSEELVFSEPYTNTTTYIELYAADGKTLLDRTFPNHSGIFTFDVRYQAGDSPYVLKLQNSTWREPLYFAANFSGPNDIDMLALQAKSVTVAGTFFVDEDHDGLQTRNERAYQYWGARPAQVALYATAADQPLATATGAEDGTFTFYIERPTVPMTYTLRSVETMERPQLAQAYTLVVGPDSATVISYPVGINPDSVPVEGQAQPNSTPLDLQVTQRTNQTLFQWATAMPLRADSVVEIAYAAHPGGPYRQLATTATGQSRSYTHYDLPRGDYYFVARAITRNGDHPELWSAYSNEVSTAVNGTSMQIFLPIVSR